MRMNGKAGLSSALYPACIVLLLLTNGFLIWKYMQARAQSGYNGRGADSQAVARLFQQPLQSLDGGSVRLADAEARFVVLFVFTPGDCHVCLQELSDLNAADSGGFQVFGLMSNASLDELGQTRQNFGVNYPLLADPDGRLSASLRLPKTPWKIVVDVKRNRIVYEDLPSVTAAERQAFLSRLNMIGNL